MSSVSMVPAPHPPRAAPEQCIGFAWQSALEARTRRDKDVVFVWLQLIAGDSRIIGYAARQHRSPEKSNTASEAS
jgi:hypothetical protein